MMPQSHTKNRAPRLTEEKEEHCRPRLNETNIQTAMKSNQLQVCIRAKAITIFFFQIPNRTGFIRPWEFSIVAHLMWGNSSHASYSAQINHNLHQNDISMESLLTSHCMFSLFRKANKSQPHFFCFRLICTNGWEKKEMVDAFIKYGNLLNGLWQSHWRSLFRCRWLPLYWLPLSLLPLPVREERRSLLFLQTDNHYHYLSVY